MEIKVSVVCPVYNQENYLRECLDSLEAQTLKETEFIIVNDGSKDGSLEIIKEYVERDSRFKLIDKENGGVGLAINTGIKAAVGEYIAELDSDDYVAADMYEKLYEIAKDADLDIIKSNVVNFTGSGDTYEGSVEKIARQGYYNRVIDPHLENNVFSFPMYAWVTLYRKELLIDNDVFWNEGVSSYNDNGFYWQTMGMANKVMYIDEAFVYHRRDNEFSTVKDPQKMYRNFFIEHAFIKEKLIERGLFENLKAYFYERKINNYFFALNVIEFDMKKDFFKLIADDFVDDIDNGNLNEVKFVNPNNQRKINLIVRNPEKYYFQEYLPEYYKVSVIVPIHNAESFIRKTLNSILTQSLRGIEVICVENGSTDGTMNILNEYAAKDPRVKVFSIGSSNAGNARNIGIEYAHGKYLSILDADDFFHKDMLAETYREAERLDADIVWYRAEQKNAITGYTVPLGTFFSVNQMPAKRPFSINDLSGNPYKAFNGWAWDKLFRADFVKDKGLKFQSQAVANDACFVNLAMSYADRITTLDKTFVTRIVSHGDNISSSLHDKNVDNDYNMMMGVLGGLESHPESEKLQAEFRKKVMRSMRWILSEGLQTDQGREKYFDLLVDHGIDQVGVMKLDTNELDQEDQANYLFFKELVSFNAGEYSKFSQRFNKAIAPAKFKPNPRIQDKKGRVIFGQSPNLSEGKLVPLFSILIDYYDTSNATAEIDFVYMGNFVPGVSDTLCLSFSNHEQEVGMGSSVDQAEWKNGNSKFVDNIFYSFVENVFTVYAKYTGKYTGFSYDIRTLTSREGRLFLSSSVLTDGYSVDPLQDVSENCHPIKKKQISNSGIFGNRAIFRVPSSEEFGIDLMEVELKNYRFNNVCLSVEFVNLPNNQPASYDTLHLGFALQPREHDLKAEMFQADWLFGRDQLKNNVYYYFRDNKLVVGARYTAQWCGYNFKISSIVGREAARDYGVTLLAPELIHGELRKIPENAMYCSNIAH